MLNQYVRSKSHNCLWCNHDGSNESGGKRWSKRQRKRSSRACGKHGTPSPSLSVISLSHACNFLCHVSFTAYGRLCTSLSCLSLVKVKLSAMYASSTRITKIIELKCNMTRDTIRHIIENLTI